MFNGLDLDFERLLFVVPAILVALTFHEFAHALIAYAYGDPTAKNAGRLTLNPLKHLEPVGTLLLIFAGFGWAKPVPVNPYYFGNKRNNKMMVVSLAGPLANLLQALIGALILRGLIAGPFGSNWFIQSGVTNYLFMFFIYYVQINVVLAMFNLIPIPPLDGSRILAGLLVGDNIRIMQPLEKYGFVVLAILAITGLLGKLIAGPVDSLAAVFFKLAGLN